ncbi:hypothetical protein DFH08DRAFT_900867 [Mycena albidolilacea]|uniref:Uncharacterized protein n=1 Tax=Mycena albidolilacea TaxID=1033008 RepID=A0AAD7EBC3_9AGAR|nr:hypothetical protein DFH08DRAFT_900867 [Mycena albidolilacea]
MMAASAAQGAVGAEPAAVLARARDTLTAWSRAWTEAWSDVIVAGTFSSSWTRPDTSWRRSVMFWRTGPTLAKFEVSCLLASMSEGMANAPSSAVGARGPASAMSAASPTTWALMPASPSWRSLVSRTRRASISTAALASESTLRAVVLCSSTPKRLGGF